MWPSLTEQHSAGIIKFSCVTQQQVENASPHHIQENKVNSNITVIDIGVYHSSKLLDTRLWHSAGHSLYVISTSWQSDAGTWVYPVFVTKHTYKATTQQHYPLSTETYSDSETVRPTWQPDVWVYVFLFELQPRRQDVNLMFQAVWSRNWRSYSATFQFLLCPTLHTVLYRNSL